MALPLPASSTNSDVLWAATWGAGGRVEDDPVWLRLRSARPNDDSGDGADTAEPVIKLTVMPFNTWQVVVVVSFIADTPAVERAVTAAGAYHANALLHIAARLDPS